MSKKVALLVKSEFYTRVVVDAPDNFNTETEKELWVEVDDKMAREIGYKVADIISSITCNFPGEIFENYITEVKNDKVCPYETDLDD